MRADRLLQILFLLRRHGRLPARRLAELLEVSERTVLRDMEALSAAGVPVYSERGRSGGCVLVEGYTTDASGLTSGEAQALFAWTSRAQVSDLGLGSELAAALTKLAASVPQPTLERADALASVLVVDRRRWFAAAEEVPLLPVLRDAAVARKRVRLAYRSASQEQATQRTVDPYGLVENAGRWYLVAAHRGKVRSYRVSRMAAASRLEEDAHVPEGLDLQAEWERMRVAFEAGMAPVELRVAVDPTVLEQFRMVALGQSASGHPPRPDGVVSVGAGEWPVLVVTARAAQPAAALVLGFGGHVRLLGPDDLRHDVVTRARATLELHTMDG
ncbi:MAG: YafY family protein [Lapillicoccus sp.]